MDSIDWSAFLADFVSLSNRSDVKGRIVSMDTASVRAAFDAADADPCDVQATNDVAAAIRTEIAAQLAANPTIQYVVILGNDRVIPFYREKDQTIIANEKLYLNGSLLKPSSPLYAALAGGFFLQQDYYVSSSPLSFEAGLVYVADHAIARLGETDMQMRAQAQAFVASDGRLNPKTAATDLLVTGYDFFADGARDVADALAGQLIATELIKPPTTWTADDVRCRFLGIGAASCSVPGLSFFNGHMSHFAHQSAAGDSVRTNEVPAAGANFIGMAISMGCHSGYSVPDGAAFTPSGLGINPNRDWVQALQMAMYIAPTGFGYGDSDIVLGNELLIVLIAERLAQDGVVAGEALKEAKLAYLQRSALTDYDLKSISQQTFYGLPMYRVVYDTQTAVQSRPSVQQIGTPAGTLNLTISERGGANPTVNKSLAIARHDTSRGSYYSLDGQFQVTAGRPTHGRYRRAVC